MVTADPSARATESDSEA